MSLTRRKLISRTALGGLVLAASGRWVPPAFAGETIKIGAPFNLTGAVASLDAPAANGAKLKAQEINDAGGVLGKKIELVIYDTKTDPTVIASTGSKLVNQDKVPVIIGFTDSDSVLALGPIAEKAGIPFVTAGATSPKLPEQVGKDMFLACFGDNVQAAAGADFMLANLGGKKIYMLSDNSAEYTTLLAHYFKEAYKKAGGHVLGETFYKSGDKSFTAQITKIKAQSTKPDALYIAAMPDDIGLVVKQLRQSGVTQPIVGGDGYDTPLLLSVGGPAANDVYYTTHAFMSTESTPGIQKFYAAYQKAYGNPPDNAFAALGYDTLGLVADAIQRAGADDPAKIRDALAATQNYQGITGAISFRPGVRVPDKTVSMIGVKENKLMLAAEVTPKWVPKP